MVKFFLISVSPPLTYALAEGLNSVGRNPTNDLRLKDATVSSFHGEIVVRAGTVHVRDLGSSNGTFVNGQSVAERGIEPGTVLRFGSVELTLDRREEPEPVVSIPVLPAPTRPAEALLPDGHPACEHHPETHAAFRCTRCEKKFCSDCVRFLGLSGGTQRVFCPACSAHCETLPLPAGVGTIPPRSKAKRLLGRLSQTIRIRHR